MSIEYDEIELKIGSKLSTKGINDAISNLNAIKNAFPMNGIKETASDMKVFADAVNSIKSDTVKALANLKSSLSKTVQELQKKDKMLNIPARISVAKKDIDNAIKIPLEQSKPEISVIDVKKERESAKQVVAETQKVMEASAKAEATRMSEIISDAIERTHPKRSSSLKGQISKGREVDLEGTYTSSASAWEDTANATEKATKSLAYYKDMVQQMHQDEYNAQLREAADEWNNIGKAIDESITESLKAYNERFDIGNDNQVPSWVILLDNAWGVFVQNFEDGVRDCADKSKILKDAIKGVASGIGQVLSPIESAVSKTLDVLGGLVRRFISISIYRAIRSILSFITNSFKEGFKNLEDWDRTLGNTGFAQQMDRARESLLAIKNALAVATAPLLEYIIGMLQRVAQWAIEAANWLSRMVAIIGGKSSYRVVKWANTVAKSEAKAGGSAKKATEEFKKQLMAFDEINNLSAPGSSGSGGGGGGGSLGDYTDMFDVDTVGDLSNFEKKVKQVFDAVKKGYAETMSSLKAKSDEFKLMWKNFFTDHDTWRADWLKKWDVALTNWSNNMAHISKALFLITQKDFEGAWNEIMAIFNEDNKEMEIAIQKYGYNWAVQHGYVRNYFTDTYSKYVHPVTLKTIEHSKEAATSITDSYDKASRGVKTAFGKIEAGSKTSRSVVIDDLTAIGKKATDITKNPYTVTVDVRENLTRYVSILETRVPTTQASALRGYGYGFAANGGFFKEGQAFIAREAGPELVGTIGGHTAVANNDQIVTAVSQGVASAVSSVLGNQGSNVTVTLEGDAKGLFKVVQKEGRAYSARTGQPALA